MNELQKLYQEQPHNLPEMERWLIHSYLAPAVQQTLREAKEKGSAKQPGRYLLARGSYFRTVAEEAPVGIFYTDARGRCIYVNRQWGAITGLSQREASGDGWTRALHPDDRDQIIGRWHQGILTEKPFCDEFRLLCPDGTVTWVFGHGIPIYNEAAVVSGYVGTLYDITEQKTVQNALIESKNTFARQLLRMQEEERRRIARELHDEMGQMLTALKLELQGMRYEPVPSLAHIAECVGMVDLMMEQVRTLLVDLRPAPLETLGLHAALRWYVNRQAQRSGMKIEFTANPIATRPPADVEISCFRIVQEALTNAIRHAQAQHVTVELRCEGESLCVKIKDDGVGFDVAATHVRAAAGASLGIIGMQERANLAGGKLSIMSAAQYGTEIQARFPLS